MDGSTGSLWDKEDGLGFAMIWQFLAHPYDSGTSNMGPKPLSTGGIPGGQLDRLSVGRRT